MSNQRQSYIVKSIDAQHMMEDHLHKLQGHEYQTISLHRRVISSLLAFLASGTPRSGIRLCFSKRHLLRWIVIDAKNKTNNYAASRLQIVNRYIRLLCDHGILPDHPLRQIKAGDANPSWNRIVEISQSPQPLRHLQQLRPKLPRRGPLYPSIDKYVDLHRALGKKYTAHHRLLCNFDSFLAKLQIGSPDSLRPQHVRQWLDRMSCSQEVRRRKLYVIKRYLDYLAGVGIMKSNPAALVIREFGRPRMQQFRPCILTQTQVAAILKMAKQLPPNHLFKLRPQTCYMILVLLYTLGLRSSEACNLRFRDIDLKQRTLQISGTKFYKTRLVPFGPKVRDCLKAYITARRKIFLPVGSDDPLFIAYRRKPIRTWTISGLFRTIVKEVVPHTSSLPRIHDLRHTFAVHCLLRWYREGVDVQSKLILLSTFMGHTEINSTEVYLTITMELLTEASERFYQNCGVLI